MVKLFDFESQYIYDMLTRTHVDKKWEVCWDMISELNKKWIFPQYFVSEIERALEEQREIICYGAGENGYFSMKTLEMFGIKVDFFCETTCMEKDKFVGGIPVISLDELITKHSQALVIITSFLYKDEIYSNLVEKCFAVDHIVVSSDGIKATNGNQYFDFFIPNEEEIFIDAGAYDGTTTLDFFKWAEGKKCFSYVMEPFEDSKALIEQNLKNYDNKKIVCKAAWDKNEVLKLGGGACGSKIGEMGTEIEGTSIDYMLDGKKATFIKMDIEGSELKALMGAEHTIKKYKPRLAISVYHKPEDLNEIPEYLSKIVPEYKFALRHYSTSACETILYAWID